MPVVNPLTNAGLVGAGFNLAIAFAEVAAMQKLRDDVDLFNTPGVNAVIPVGNIANKGADTLKTQHVQSGWNRPLQPVAETAPVGPTGVDVDPGDVAVGRFALALEESQKHQITDRSGMLSAPALAASGVDSFRASRMDTLAGVLPGFTGAVGTPTSPASIDDLFEMNAEARLSNWRPGPNNPIILAASGQQINDIIESSRAEQGSFVERMDAQDVLSVAGRQFRLLNINVFLVNRVQTNGGVIQGGVWIPGAIGHAMGSVENIWSDWGTQKPAGMPLIINYDDNPGSALLQIIFNAYYGVDILGVSGDEFGRVYESLAA